MFRSFWLPETLPLESWPSEGSVLIPMEEVAGKAFEVGAELCMSRVAEALLEAVGEVGSSCE